MEDVFDDDLDDLPADEVPATAGSGEVRVVTIDASLAGQRLDKALAASLADFSRARLQALITAGAVSVDGTAWTDGNAKVRDGLVVTIDVPAAISAIPLPQKIPLNITYEDEYLLVIDKQAGLVVHPGAGNEDGTLVNALLAYCGEQLSGIGGVRRPGIVHRLDKDTSGLMVAAKTDAAHRGLSAQLADRTLSRTYNAVVWGTPAPRAGRIDAPIGRSPSNRRKMAVVRHGGREAVTLYSTIAQVGAKASLVECKLMTGRTHQIRVHMAQQGHPLVGDPLYGRTRNENSALARFPRQALHATAIAFVHPIDGREMSFTSDVPDDLRALLDAPD
ncbi:RluA family pseudouridine synthase [Roseiterribacter gracilis]|uniref:Pseudouridine synthase n=1 Tax=Roseiterribacter gracilis TaxID=2812848 RepID=A0A8S8XG90_9PROT|nr:pseudouridine synthase [Rhodospirillales bacterium TMPK1]